MAVDPGYNLNWLFFKRFARLHGVMYPRLLSLNFGLFLLLVACSGLEQFLAYRTGIIAGQFFKELGDRDLESFKMTAIVNILIVLAISVTLSIRVLITKSLTVAWRRSICKYFHNLYLADFNYYRLNVVDRSLDNPDQRITADVSSLLEAYSSIIYKLIVTPFTVAYYTYDAFTRAGWIGPTGMFLLFLVSTVVNKMLMKPVINTTVNLEKREGDFRFKHIMVRSNAESLAFHGDPHIENKKVNEKLNDVCSTQQHLYYRNFGIDVSVNTFSYLGAIASYLVIAVPIFTGVYDDKTGSELSQAISENAFVCIYLISQLGNLVQITGIVASMAGSTHRVCELREKLEQYKNNRNPPPNQTNDNPNYVVVHGENKKRDYDINEKSDEKKPWQNSGKGVMSPYSAHSKSSSTKNPTDGAMESDDLILLNGFSLEPPSNSSGAFLIRNLDLVINKNRNLLIMGPSSSGKSSLLRALRGLWIPSDGTIQFKRNLHESLFFLPQKPFFTNGTLREQIFYPNLPSYSSLTWDDGDIKRLLQVADLTGLLDRCNGLDFEPSWNWYDVLSPGEAQRLAFVRLFVHQPVLAVLDEATSAISQGVETKLYTECLNMGICLLSVGHRETLKQFHSQVLTLTGLNGGWKLEEIPKNKNMKHLNPTETLEMPLKESLPSKDSLVSNLSNQTVDNDNVSSDNSSLCNDSSTKSLI